MQGEGAAQEIVAGIRLANRLSPRPDVLIVGRGGGSLEDLWSFNEEPVVRAIAASKIPTVSAVGHEIDVTLADLVADVRALTPSEAAERIVPAAEEISARIRAYQQRLRHAAHRRVMWLRARYDGIVAQRPFRRPFDLIHDRSRRLDELAMHGNSLCSVAAGSRRPAGDDGGQVRFAQPVGSARPWVYHYAGCATGAVIGNASEFALANRS